MNVKRTLPSNRSDQDETHRPSGGSIPARPTSLVLIGPFLAGLVFAIGLGVSGMTSPDRVVGFLRLGPDWDPSLAFVMAGAMAVYFVGFRLVVGRGKPLLASEFFLPTRRDIDARLVGGAALFGLGWGLAGFCPGPAIASQVTLAPEALAFFGAMITGMLAHRQLDLWRERRRDDASLPPADPAPSSSS